MLRMTLVTLIPQLWLAAAVPSAVEADVETLNLWPGGAPGETRQLPPEADQTKPGDRLIAGRRIIKLGNVSTPQIAIYRPERDANGAAVLICPGGGHHILAYDLEGVEVAQWLTTFGVTGIVLKYRVPFRDPDRRWRAAVQDAQRAMSLVRRRAKQWRLDPNRLGILGFSAGGETAALASLLLDDRQYEPVDAVDVVSSRPDFAMLIYPARLVQQGTSQFRDDVRVTKEAPPMFLVHAFDDRVSVHNSLALAMHLKKADVSTELHVYESGGHGYGLRRTKAAVTSWPDRARQWMTSQGWLTAKSQEPSSR